MPLHSQEELLAGLPPAPQVSAEDVVCAQQASRRSLVQVVLDDDPTGTQSVAGLPVLIAWEVTDFIWAFQTEAPAIYVMTNSRSLTAENAEAINRQVIGAALTAASKVGKELSFVSRSDSTLRGHFPLEPNTIADCLQNQTDPITGTIICPAFPDAGRITIAGVHYAGNPETGYLPVGETEFAADATFGYQNSYLPDWVAEKTGGGVAKQVLVLDIHTLRTDLEAAVELLQSAKDGQPIVVDAVVEADLRQLALALIKAEDAGSRFIYRVGPPFVRARIGQTEHPPLTPAEISTVSKTSNNTPGGLLVVGSHVGLTTRQLAYLKETTAIVELEINVAKILQETSRKQYLTQIVTDAVKALANGNVLIQTSRDLVRGADADESLKISRKVSASVVEVVQEILAEVSPRFVIAKGGITSSDVASKGLGIRHAMVVGPMLRGIVSLWVGQDGRGAGIPYVVFAGNVG
ncbi:MAG: hypothetical protein CSA83_00960, partial [Actinomycetales bacterium]